MKKILILALIFLSTPTTCSNRQMTIINSFVFGLASATGAARALKEPIYSLEIGAGVYAALRATHMVQYDKEAPPRQRLLGPCFLAGYVTGYAAGRAVRAGIKFAQSEPKVSK